MTGCDTLQPRTDQDTGYPRGIPTRAELTSVPFFPQDQYQCGPAALAMALGFAGIARTPQQLVDQVYLPQREGSLQPEMLAATRRAGLIAYPLQPEFGKLVHEIAAGHPVVVLQNLRFEWFPQWHYAVAMGYDAINQELILRSGPQSRLVVSQGDFIGSWAKAGKWAFVAMPPGDLPATASEDAYVGAATSLERVSPKAARKAYEAVLVKWPGNLVARLGLGNIAYGLHDLNEAAREYGKATREHEDSGDAWNNLAQVLHEMGLNAEALVAAERAISIGGPRLQTYQATLQTVRSAQSQK